MKKGPAFIGIGVQKAGTTWLWENLRRHPQLWLPVVKELHWFDTRYPPEALAGVPLYRHRTGLARYRPLRRDLSWEHARWLWRFYQYTTCDGDYLALFDRDDLLLAGEITPAYATLSANTVEMIRHLVSSDCRIILILREPLERLCSGVRMHCRRHGINWHSLPDNELDNLLSSPQHFLRSDYAYTLKHWSVFGERLGVFFYEDLRDDPQKFLVNILRFLSVDQLWQSPILRKYSNASNESAGVPKAISERWQPRIEPIVQAVKKFVGQVPSSWTHGY